MQKIKFKITKISKLPYRNQLVTNEPSCQHDDCISYEQHNVPNAAKLHDIDNIILQQVDGFLPRFVERCAVQRHHNECINHDILEDRVQEFYDPGKREAERFRYRMFSAP